MCIANKDFVLVKFTHSYKVDISIGVRGGGGGAGGAAALPSLVKNMNYSGNFYLVFQSLFCFTNILNIFFSFVNCSMHKNPHQNAGNGIKETLFFKIFLGSMPPDPPRGSNRANSYPPPPPKISKPVRLWMFLCLL